MRIAILVQERNYYMQLLLRNDRFCAHDPRVNLPYLKPVTGNNLPTPDKAGLLASITKEMNQSMERAIAGNSRVPDNGVKANTIGKYAAENGNTAAIKRFKASQDIGDSTV